MSESFLRRRLCLPLLAALSAACTVALACPYTIRDAGFIVRDPSPYRLCICVADRTPGREHLDEWLRDSAAELLAEANVEVETVNLDHDPDHEATAGLASPELRELPAAVLVSPGGDALRMPGPATDRMADEQLLALVGAVASSPKRDELKAHLVDNWCVTVLAEGSDTTANQRARAAAKAAGEEIVGKSTELGQVIETEPHLLAVAADDPAERLLIASLGLADGDPADPRLAVVFGAGRRLGPVLQGAEIAKRPVLEYLEMLARSCTCTSDPGELLGPSVPLVWDADTRARAREALGFDPEKPEVRMVLAGVWQSLAAPDRSASEPFGYTDEYVEFPVETSAQPPGVTGELPEAKAPLGTRVAHLLIVLLAGIGVVGAAVGGVLFLRRTKSS